MHAQVLLFLFSLRELHPELEHQCLHGSCFRLHQLLALVFPGAEPWYDHDHVITLIGGRFYDIRGEVLAAVPRVRGDEPAASTVTADLQTCSPRARG